MEALASLKGYKMKGEGAHKELIDYVCEEFGFEEGSRLFLQEMRNYRNRISYEGFMIKENYVSQNEEKIEDIVHRLFKHLEDDL